MGDGASTDEPFYHSILVSVVRRENPKRGRIMATIYLSCGFSEWLDGPGQWSCQTTPGL
jgi:hypothetical protein